MSKAIQELFTSIAPHYDFLNRTLSLSIDKQWRQKAIAQFHKSNPKIILDLCAGTLDLTQGLQSRFPQANIISVDFSIAMLVHGQKKIQKPEQVFSLCGDGHQLPLKDNSMDGVICGFGIRNLENRAQAAEEIRRVLKLGGKLVVLEFFRPDQFFSKLFYQTYGKHVIPRLGGMFSNNREAYQYLQDSIQDFLSVEEYASFLKDNGFSNVHYQKLSGGIAHLVNAD